MSSHIDKFEAWASRDPLCWNIREKSWSGKTYRDINTECACTGYVAGYQAAIDDGKPTYAKESGPTTYLQRFGDAMQALCGGVRPGDDVLRAWLDPDVESFALQEFAIEHGPAWAQGIVVIDAARVLADSPTEGIEHGDAPERASACQEAA